MAIVKVGKISYMAKDRADYKTRFQGKGIGIKHKQKPVSVMLPDDIDAIVRAMPNRSEFIRQAIIEKLEREQCASNKA